MILLENLIHICCLFLHWALSNCCDPWENYFHAFMIQIHVHTTYPLLCFYEKLALYHPSIPQNKCSTNCVGLSLVFIKKERGMGYKKNMDTWRSKYWKKKKKKYMDTWRSMKKKDSPALKKILYVGREIIQKEFPSQPTQSIHMHILIWLYDLFFSLDPVFDFVIYVIQVCLILHTLPWAPHIAITRSRMKKRQVKCLGKDIYTLSDLRESNEELSKVCFENLLKNPKLLDMRSRSAWTTQDGMIDISKVHKCKVWVGISLMLASYLWKSCSTLVHSALLKDEQMLSVGELLTALKS